MFKEYYTILLQRKIYMNVHILVHTLSEKKCLPSDLSLTLKFKTQYDNHLYVQLIYF